MFNNWFVPGPPVISARTGMKSNSRQSWRFTVDQPLPAVQFVDSNRSSPSRLKTSAKRRGCAPAHKTSAATRHQVRFHFCIAISLLIWTIGLRHQHDAEKPLAARVALRCDLDLSRPSERRWCRHPVNKIFRVLNEIVAPTLCSEGQIESTSRASNARDLRNTRRAAERQRHQIGRAHV